MPRYKKEKLMSDRASYDGAISFSESDGESDREDGPAKKKRFTKKEGLVVCMGVAFVLVAVLLFIIIGLATTHPPTSSSYLPWKDVRLSSNVRPNLYTLQLDVDMKSFKVSGSVSIDVTISSETEYIILHVKNMTVRQVTVYKGQVQSLSIAESFNYEPNEFYVVKLAEKASGDVRVALEFSYTLGTDLAGFYNSTYKSPSGKVQTLVCTQFEPTDARKAFPCFDEPNMKANFSITLVHEGTYTAVSNMPVKSVQPEGTNGKMKTTFHTSLKMSTYLVAFVLSDFAQISTISQGKNISVWSRPSLVEEGRYALKVAKTVLSFYEEFFNISYPLPKQDLFGIPDFAAGAMENWGLITYRETAILYNETTVPRRLKQWVAAVVAHELAHQWFGNLVTMEWWNDLWLNEGFAAYMEYLGADKADGSLHFMDQFVARDYQNAMDLDSLLSTHPIEAPVDHPDEINSQFDSISYDKGASLLRMLHLHLGDKFQKGLTRYLQSHSYGNAVMSDLWTALDSVVGGSSVMDMMNTWTVQPGYPVVKVTAVDGSKVMLQQSRFLQVPSNESSNSYMWIIPISFRTDKVSSVQQMLMDKKTATINLGTGASWYKINVDHTSFIRVNYDSQNWKRLINHLTMTNLSDSLLTPSDRAGLLDDAFALSSAGQLGIKTALDLSRYLSKETHYVPWLTGIVWINKMATKLHFSKDYGTFENYVSELLKPIVAKFTWTTDNTMDNLDIFLRSLVFTASWSFGDQNTLGKAVEIFNELVDNDTSVHPDLKDTVYAAGVYAGGEKEWNFLWQRYQNTTDPLEQSIILSALALPREPWLLNRFLRYALTDVRSQDSLYVIRNVARNQYGFLLAWRYFKENLNTILSRYGLGSHALGRVIRTFGAGFHSEFDLKEFQMVTASVEGMSELRSTKQGIEAIKGNIYWHKNLHRSVTSWLKQQI